MARKLLWSPPRMAMNMLSDGRPAAVLPFIAGAGADGVEIRRELFSEEELNSLPALAATIERSPAAATPRPPPCAARRHPQPGLPALLAEAHTLNALWLKVSLGHFSESVLETLRLACESGMALVVENDQTDCGQLAPMQRFRPPAGSGAAGHADLRYGQLAVGRRLAGRGRASSGPAVSYIHVKAASHIMRIPRRRAGSGR
jgi:hypothetical protein